MSHSVTVRYDKPIVRRALNAYVVKRLGKPFFIALVAVISLLIWSAVSGVWSWWLTVVAVLIFAGLAFLLFVYIARLRAAEGFFDKANEPVVTFTFTDTAVRTESDIGTVDLNWEVFDEVLKFREVWLLVYARSGYMTLPVDQLTPDCMSFIDQKIDGTKGPAR